MKEFAKDSNILHFSMDFLVLLGNYLHLGRSITVFFSGSQDSNDPSECQHPYDLGSHIELP